MLMLRSVSAWYGKALALDAVSMEVDERSTTALIGANGAGKTTLLRVVARVHREFAGAIVIDGKDLTRADAAQVAIAGVSLVRERAPIFTGMTVAQNFELGMRLARKRDRDPLPLELVWEWFPALETRQRHRADALSGGQRQMLALATAVISAPDLLLLDEPSAGLAPPMIAALFGLIGSARVAGIPTATVVAEQDVAVAVEYADTVVTIRRGRCESDADLHQAHEAVGGDDTHC